MFSAMPKKGPDVANRKAKLSWSVYLSLEHTSLEKVEKVVDGTRNSTYYQNAPNTATRTAFFPLYIHQARTMYLWLPPVLDYIDSYSYSVTVLI